MIEATILEGSENLKNERIVTVKTPRGEEFVINADIAAMALATMFSDHTNERRRGWELMRPWYEEEIKKLRACIMGWTSA